MEKLFLCIVSSLLWSHAFSESCTTPLGQSSECVDLYDCPALADAFSQRPMPDDVVSFLRQSYCGLNGNTPKVCCGPLQLQSKLTTPLSGPNVKTNTLLSDQIEPANQEDLILAPRGTCGLDTNGDRIIGGTATELDEFPWMALLGYRRPTGGLTYQCGGALINQRYVLTAAHCITGKIELQVGKLETIRLGEHDRRNEVDCVDGRCADRPQEIPVQIAVAHPEFIFKNRIVRDDIGIARLARKAKYSFFVKPICLFYNIEQPIAGTEVFVAGWGQTNTTSYSEVKQKLSIPMYNKQECVTKYSSIGVAISDKQICAGGVANADTCRGDSGGPLMRKLPSEGIWETIGIVSFGHFCGMDGWPGVYTSIAHYRDWIDSMIRATNV